MMTASTSCMSFSGSSGWPRVCVRPDPASRTDRIYVEGGIVFHPDTTQPEELEVLVTRTVGAAGKIAAKMVEREDI